MPKNKSENPTGLMGDLSYSISLRDGKSSGVWDKDHKGRRKFEFSMTIINFCSQVLILLQSQLIINSLPI